MYLSSHKNLAYWRKANWLHGFIVKSFAGGIDQCQEIVLTKENVKLVFDKVCEAAAILEGASIVPQKHVKTDTGTGVICDLVDDGEPVPIGKDGAGLATIVWQWNRPWAIDSAARDRLAKLLPPFDGLFFGSQDFDEYYANDVFETRRVLKTVLDEWDDDSTYVYRASW